MKLKEVENPNKYQDLSRELKKLWNIKIPVGVGTGETRKEISETGDQKNDHDHTGGVLVV